jgi:3-mercaptopyruvate sulfurtransferase SseA
LAVGLLAACNSTEQHRANTNANASQPVAGKQTTTTPATTNDGVRRITTVELKNALDKGEAIVIDVRTSSAYEAGHIKGARLIPVSDFLAQADGLPHDKLIVTYCS